MIQDISINLSWSAWRDAETPPRISRTRRTGPRESTIPTRTKQHGTVARVWFIKWGSTEVVDFAMTLAQFCFPSKALDISRSVITQSRKDELASILQTAAQAHKGEVRRDPEH